MYHQEIDLSSFSFGLFGLKEKESILKITNDNWSDNESKVVFYDW